MYALLVASAEKQRTFRARLTRAAYSCTGTGEDQSAKHRQMLNGRIVQFDGNSYDDYQTCLWTTCTAQDGL